MTIDRTTSGCRFYAQDEMSIWGLRSWGRTTPQGYASLDTLLYFRTFPCLFVSRVLAAVLGQLFCMHGVVGSAHNDHQPLPWKRGRE